jgi:hypothetical protein
VKYHKRYVDDAEAQLRFDIFKSNYERINAHNAGNRSYTMAVNEFADMTWAEFSATRMGYLGGVVGNVSGVRDDVFVTPSNDVDWRGRLPGVKNQGGCGSCWAFATVATVEFLCGGSLSEQELVDCDSGDSGCGGGLPAIAYNFVQAQGLEDEGAYPYTGARGGCRYNPGAARCHISGHGQTSGEGGLQGVVNQRVAAVGIAAGPDLQFYHGGIFVGGCAAQLNHAVAVVGYGAGYWLVRNSWGAGWGEGGYVRFQAGVNLCGIGNDVSYPY